MRFLTVQEVIAINQYIIEKYSPHEIKGVRDPRLLESAVNRSKQSAFGEEAYPTLHEKTGALFQSLAQNHPFHNANKRTAFVCLVQFLKYNGYTFTMPPKQAEDFVVAVVNREYSFEEIVALIREFSSSIKSL